MIEWKAGNLQRKPSQAIKEVQTILDTYPEMAGVYDWEYLNAPPIKHDPSQWCKQMKDSELIQWDKV